MIMLIFLFVEFFFLFIFHLLFEFFLPSGPAIHTTPKMKKKKIDVCTYSRMCMEGTNGNK